ncbi:phosphotriesterase [soil metagenome]
MPVPRPSRTVLGDVDPGKLGVTYAHEHLIIDPSLPSSRGPEFLLDSADAAARELAAFRESGGRTVIDALPCDAGRNVLKLADASRRSGVNIIASTGLHVESSYPAGHWSHRYAAEALAALFIADVEEGIDRFDYVGPLVSRTRHRAGVITVASGKGGLSDYQSKVFRAAAIAHAVTGAPILTQAEHGAAALEQVEALRGFGVDPDAVILAHTDRIPDLPYHREILSSGARVVYECAFRWRVGQPNHTADLVVALIDEFHDQIMLGMDAARRTYWHAYGGAPGLPFLLGPFSRMLLDRGLSDAQWAKVFVSTPARAFALRTPDPDRIVGKIPPPRFVPPS